MFAGATMAIEEINAASGILGNKLKLKFMDEELKPAVAVKNVRYLVDEWGAHFLILSVTREMAADAFKGLRYVI